MKVQNSSEERVDGAAFPLSRVQPGDVQENGRQTVVSKSMDGNIVKQLPVFDEEDPWTQDEVSQVRAELTGDRARLRSDINQSEREVSQRLLDCAGDVADLGTATSEREHGMSLTATARDLLAQTEHALGRIKTGQYGSCASCARPIGKERLMAFPRATLCIPCKKEQERG